MNSLISWFARNGVVANLLMIVLIGAGVLGIVTVKKEVFPEISVDMISVSVSYRGAAPQEVESGVLLRVEEAVQGIDGVDRVISTANEGVGSVTIEVETGYDIREVLDDVKSAVDAIDTFPEETEQPVIKEITNRMQVINLSVSGDTDELTLKKLGERVRDELLALPEITQADLKSARPYEIAIEVSEESLRRYNLTFDFVATAVRRASIDLPGGSVKTATGEILLRTEGQAYVGSEFEDLTLLTRADGTRLRLSDVATIIDGFEETDQSSRLDGKDAVLVQIFRVGDQSAIEIADAVYSYIAEAQPRMPAGITLTPWADSAKLLKSRMDLLIRNALSGLALVFIVLMLFLRLRLAFWVTLGIPLSFLGAIAMMPTLDVSVNMISLFSFILVLGIVVDDAIVVSESIHLRQQEGGDALEAAISGAQEVATPVIFGVLTTVAAFAPMLFVPGVNGKIWRVIPCIVIPTLLFSLLESKLILPSHLSHHKKKPAAANPGLISRAWNGFFNFFSEGLEWFIQRIYKPTLDLALSWRYATIAIALSTLLLTVGMVGGGFVKFVFFPQVESDNVVADLTLPQQTPADVTEDAVRKLEQAALELSAQLEKEQGSPVFQHMLTSVGEQPFRVQAARNSGDNRSSYSSSNIGEVNIELTPSEQRTIPATEIANRWRELAPAIPDVVELSFTSDLLGSSDAIDIQLSGRDIEQLQRVSNEIKGRLASYPGVIDINDSFRGGKPEVQLDITNDAEALGLSLSDLGRQVRQAFFGEEAQRIQRGRDDVRVMVRYPEADRRSLGDLERMRIRTPDGGEVPFSTVATASMGRGFASITRVDRERTINVRADVDETVTNANEVIADLEAGFLPELIQRNRGVHYSLEGVQQDQSEAIEALGIGFVGALFVVYALMAIPFRSYVQPLIVMSAIPFGIVGAVWGHLFMGMDMSILSLCGVVALAGVVVNDSLVLVSFMNQHRDDGLPLHKAVVRAGVARFRPILLTSLTTAAGITPLMLERSVQAQFLIPMAVALAFGVLFSTAITLVIVPAIYLVLEDIRGFFQWLYGGESSEKPQRKETRGPEREGARGLRAARVAVEGD